MSLFKHIFSYSLANIINAAVPFLLLPILTTYLNPNEFGMLSLIQLLLALSLPLVLLNIHGLFTIEYSKLSHDDFTSFISTIIWIPIIGFIILETFFWIFADSLLHLFQIPKKWILYTPLFALMQSIPTMIPVLFQAKKEPLNYALYKIFLTIVNFGLSILFVISLIQGWEGRLWGIFWSYAFFSFLGIIILYKMNLLKLQISLSFIKNSLKFGIPLIPHALAGILLSMSDRLFLANMLGVTEVGIYSVAFQMASGIGIIMSSINQAWVPHLYEQLNQNPNVAQKKKIVIQTYKIMALMFLVTIIFVTCLPVLFEFFINHKYYEGINLSRFIIIAFMFQGFYFMITNYIFYVKKTYLLSIVTMISAIVLIGLNYIFIPLYGMFGSAYAMIIGWSILFCLAWGLANKVYQMPWMIR